MEYFNCPVIVCEKQNLDLLRVVVFVFFGERNVPHYLEYKVTVSLIL